MRTGLVLIGVFLATAAIAEDKPPMVGDRPLLQVKPKVAAPKAQTAAAKKPQSTAAKLQACLDLDDGTKDRLNCFDAIFAPKPNPKAAAAKGVADCRFKKEEDERLGCYNDFAERIPKLPKS